MVRGIPAETERSLRAEIVVLGYFSGVSLDETAAAPGVSPGTVDTERWFARAWLHQELSEGEIPVRHCRHAFIPVEDTLCADGRTAFSKDE
jgi:hypothetical protein